MRQDKYRIFVLSDSCVLSLPVATQPDVWTFG